MRNPAREKKRYIPLHPAAGSFILDYPKAMPA
jgi:hypothetical protein